MEATKWLKPLVSGSRIGDRASVQAATRVNAEQASKLSCGRFNWCAGIGDACARARRRIGRRPNAWPAERAS